MSTSPDYSRIINSTHYKRLLSTLNSQLSHNPKTKINQGTLEDCNEKQLYIPFFLLSDVHKSDPVMKDEIFGPILPIITVDSEWEAIDFINEHEKPLALYGFSKSKEMIDLVIGNTSSGVSMGNDLFMHSKHFIELFYFNFGNSVDS